MGFEKVYITKQGALLAAKTLQGKMIEFDHAEVGSGNLSGNAVDKTALTTKVLECTIRKIEITEKTQAKVSFMFKNTDASNAFYFREIGLFAIDPDTKAKVLYAYANAGDRAEYINNSITEKIEKYIDIIIAIDNSSNVVVTTDDTQIYVTERELLNEKVALEEQIQKTDQKLQSQINSLASGSPKGSYVTVNDLKTANPETGVYIVQEDGHVYSWTKNSENAIDLGVYQSMILADNSVNYNNLSQTLKNISDIRIPTLNIINNHYIFRTGIISSELNGWSYTQPFVLKKNETVVYFNKGSDQNVAMISVSNSDGTEIDPQVISVNSLEQIYTFTASDDCYIMLSGSTSLISNVAIYTKLNYQFSDYVLNNLIANNALLDFKNNNLITDNLSLNKSSNTSFNINNNSDDIFKKICDVTINSDGELSYSYNFYFYRKFPIPSDKINKIVAILDVKGQPNKNIFFRLAKQKGILIKNGDNFENINPNTFTRFFIITDENTNLSDIEELQIGILSTTPEPINTTLTIRLLGFAINVNETYFSNNFLTLLDYKNIFTPELHKEKPLDNIIQSGGFVNIFNKIACFGDSLTVGQFEANNTGSTTYNTEPDYSYPTQMKRILNNTVLTFGRGGACASNSNTSVSESHSWLNIFQNTAFSDDNKCECYILALGTNDIGYYGSFDGNVETDVDTSNYNNNAKNSVGGYATIIQKIKELQPKAKIFCCAIPNTRNSLETRTEANQKISSICDLFDNCYFMDFQTYGVQPDNVADYKSIYYLGGHMSSQGYYYWALQILSYIDYIIRNNPNDFKQIPFIGTDLSYN